MRRKLLLTAAGIAALAFGVGPAYAAGEDQFFGTLTGAALGGIVGNQFGHGDGRLAATAAGVVAGGWIGNDVGRSLDNSRATAPGAVAPISSAGNVPILNSGYKPNYVAPDDAAAPQSVYDDSYGSYCRPYSEEVRSGNQVRETYGTACLQPDGSWRAVDDE